MSAKRIKFVLNQIFYGFMIEKNSLLKSSSGSSSGGVPLIKPFAMSIKLPIASMPARPSASGDPESVDERHMYFPRKIMTGMGKRVRQRADFASLHNARNFFASIACS